MDLFKVSHTSLLALSDGVPLTDDVTSVMWTERYRSAGEFEIVAPLSSGLKDFLPLGTLISHLKTLEVMMVENLQIKDDGVNTPEIVITGRSLEAFLEERIVGGNTNFPVSPPLTNYELAGSSSTTSYDQAVQLIEDHIDATGFGGPASDLLSVNVATYMQSGSNFYEGKETRVVKKGPLYKELLEILGIDDLGIKTKRPYSGNGLTFEIHDGLDKRDVVNFSWQTGDLENAEYLWSLKKLKTQAIVVGKWTEIRYPDSQGYSLSGYDHRMMFIDGTDIDDKYTSTPSANDILTIQDKMATRAEQELAKQKLVEISRVDVSSNARFEYRVDYNIGDIVRVDGNYGTTEVMRVIEHVEIEDKDGNTNHPTLEIYKGPNPNIT